MGLEYNILGDLEKIIKKKELEACQQGNLNDENVAKEQIFEVKTREA